MQKVKYTLKGLDCANCAMKLENKLNKLPEVEEASINFATLGCVIQFKEFNEEIENKVIKVITDFEEIEVIKVKQNNHHEHAHEHHHHHEHDHEECGCGHDHHHDHEHEECGCGHDHHHDHDHEECSCGHDHHHEHDHEECGCGHDHHHEHDHEECSCVHDHHHDHEHEECGCDHDHHHEHDHEECGCGHDHHHEHEHEECGCGHEHHHEHEECGCGHDHHHDHEHEECGCGHDHHHHHHHHEHGESCSCGHEHAESTRAQKGKNKWTVSGLDCANCALKVEDKLNTLTGVKHASLNFSTSTLLFDLEAGVNEQEVKNLMKKTILEMEDGVTISEGKSEVQPQKNSEARELMITVIIGIVLLIAGIVIKNELLSVTLYLAAYLVVGWKVLRKAFKNIMRKDIFDENFLMCIATIGAIIVGEYLEAVGVMIFYEIGEMFQSIAVGKSRASIAALMDIKSEIAHLVKNGKEIEVHPETVNVNDIILVKPGERIPLDGIVIDGIGSLDTSALTGESMPVEIETGSEVMAGSVNLNSLIQIRVSKVYGESTVSRILELVENASSKKAKTEQKITKFARVYTPIVVVLALCIAIIPNFFNTGIDWSEWLRRACTFLVISCPCALVLSVPLGYFAGIGAASRKGILIKGGNYLEVLKDLDTVVLDKTGTLTSGTFSVTGVNPAKGEAENLLKVAAYAESYSTHPIAKSIIKAFGQEIDKTQISDIEEVAGHGVVCKLNGETIYAGNMKLMKKYGIEATESDENGTIVYVAKNNEFLGSVTIADTIKPTTKNALKEMKANGIKKTIMLTGDREKAALAVAKEIGIDEVHAQLLPTDKVSEIEKILAKKSNGMVAFVGDGINDAPVLARCDLGIAMGGIGSEAAIEAADIVLMKDNLEAIPEAISVAKYTQKILNQNIIFILTIKFLVLILGAFGYANMWMGVFADVGVALIAILNSTRILKA